MKICEKTVAAATVVYKTYDLMQHSIKALLKYYPNIDIIVVDNSPGDLPQNIKKFCNEKQITLIRTEENEGHGPGMDRALNLTTADLLYIFDTDTEMYKENFLEDAIESVNNNEFYGIGDCISFKYKLHGVICEYIHPAVCIINVEQYKKFAPCHDHGAPMIAPMMDLARKEKSNLLFHFPVSKYVHHFWRGTRDFCKSNNERPSYVEHYDKKSKYKIRHENKIGKNKD